MDPTPISICAQKIFMHLCKETIAILVNKTDPDLFFNQWVQKSSC